MSQAFAAVEIRGQWFAIEATHLEEILGPRPWMVVHGTPPASPGAMAWRGGALPLLDLGLLTGRAPALEPGLVRRRNAVCRLPGRLALAVPVDSVREAALVDSEQLHEPDGTPYCAGTVELEERRMPILDVGQIAAALLPGQPLSPR